jgi:hypothetical protein
MSKDTSHRLAIVLIHNNESHRLSYLKPHLARLAQRLNCTVQEVHEQDDISALDRFKSIKRDFGLLYLEAKWQSYKKDEKIPFSRTVKAGFEILKKHVSNAASKRHRRTAAIEIIVAKKHRTAWLSAKNEYDFILVMEDDAIFTDDTIENFEKTYSDIISAYKNSLLYVDLAGGFELEKLGVEQLIAKRADGLVKFSRPVTNTACTYLISSQTAHLFCDMLARNPWFQDAPIDWLINGLLMKALKTDVAFHCLHTEPPYWLHGSMQGHYPAWER